MMGEGQQKNQSALCTWMKLEKNKCNTGYFFEKDVTFKPRSGSPQAESAVLE